MGERSIGRNAFVQVNAISVSASLATLSCACSGSAKIVPTQGPHNERSTPSTSQASSPAKRPSDLPPPPPPPMPSRRVYNDTSASPSMPATPSASASSSKMITSSVEHNPFASSDPHSQLHPQPPLHPSRSESSRSVTGSATETGTGTSRHSVHNPFVVQRQDELASKSPPGLPPCNRRLSSHPHDTPRPASLAVPAPSLSQNNPPITPRNTLPQSPQSAPPHHPHPTLTARHKTRPVDEQSRGAAGEGARAAAPRPQGQPCRDRFLFPRWDEHQPQPQQAPGQSPLSARQQSRGESPTAQRRIYAPSSASSAPDGAPLPPPRRQYQPSPLPPLTAVSANSSKQVTLAAAPHPPEPTAAAAGTQAVPHPEHRQLPRLLKVFLTRAVVTPTLDYASHTLRSLSSSKTSAAGFEESNPLVIDVRHVSLPLPGPALHWAGVDHDFVFCVGGMG
ncbi:hypothetical protein CVT26_001349 [Gymnopilus dilepis]|uniref:Uncharacterized protein n=1 Tax=Gymnopilus dilepis TaxID=231916 RepID=A0A409YM28_9AGAR|nr:hypothetical protein CVT26_001349 [Gymnopilus dilepis]